jgi:hypothetical protein
MSERKRTSAAVKADVTILERESTGAPAGTPPSGLRREATAFERLAERILARALSSDSERWLRESRQPNGE